MSRGMIEAFLLSLIKWLGAALNAAARIAPLFRSKRRERQRALLRERFERLYAPMRALFLDVHITTVSSTKYPYFRSRVRRFWRQLQKVGLWRAWRLLFDRGESRPSSEVEFGSFPFSAVERIASENATVADATLLRLINAVNRSRYESQIQDLGSSRYYARSLGDEEMALVDHIFDQYDRLLRQFERGD
jgi:hypothetical protein